MVKGRGQEETTSHEMSSDLVCCLLPSLQFWHFSEVVCIVLEALGGLHYNLNFKHDEGKRE